MGTPLTMQDIQPISDAFKAAAQFYHNGGATYSVTDLMRPPKIFQLTQRHRDELPEPLVKDQIASVQGSAVHSYMDFQLRRANSMLQRGYILERRLWDKILGRKISGKFDIWHDNVLYDLKTTKTWKYIFGDYKDYVVQLNLYAYLAELDGLEVDSLAIIMWFMNWEENRVDTKGYPKEPIVQVPIELWSFQYREEFIHGLIQLHKDNEDVPDEELTPCTEADMWVKQTRYAIMEPGKKRATRVLDTEDEVENYVKWRNENGKALTEYTVDVRAGERTRCERFCHVNKWCDQYKEYMNGGKS